MSAFADFRVGDRVKSAALGLGVVMRVNDEGLYIVYDSPICRGFYSKHWFTAHPRNMQRLDAQAEHVA
jgi:hypothetical protein